MHFVELIIELTRIYAAGGKRSIRFVKFIRFQLRRWSRKSSLTALKMKASPLKVFLLFMLTQSWRTGLPVFQLFGSNPIFTNNFFAWVLVRILFLILSLHVSAGRKLKMNPINRFCKFFLKLILYVSPHFIKYKLSFDDHKLVKSLCNLN